MPQSIAAVNISPDMTSSGFNNRRRDFFIDPQYSEGRFLLLLVANDRGLTLVFGSLLGGAGDDYASDIAIGDDGCIYLVGYTQSVDFPVEGSIQVYQ